MRKKPYLTPRMKVHEMEPESIICTSFGAKVEILEGDDFGWGSTGSGAEQLSGDDFNWK